MPHRPGPTQVGRKPRQERNSFDMLARRLVALTAAIALLSGTFAFPHFAAAAPVLTLPFSNGETWKIIQGYNCGSHGDNEDSLDLVRVGGATRGAPVTAAAPGRVTYT